MQLLDVSAVAAHLPLLKGSMTSAWTAIHDNLQGSILPFGLILWAYIAQLGSLRRLLGESQPPLEMVVRREQLLDLCCNLFFGVGVIWTAIGMRDALIQALGDPAASAATGAFDVLQRMVDGGILLALSTTIVGGIGGYLMRACKSVLLGRQLNRLYLRASEQQAVAGLASLERIERSLSAAGAEAGEFPRERS